MRDVIKYKKLFRGWYEATVSGTIVYTINYDSERGKGNQWNLYEGDDVLRGLLDTFSTLKEAKQTVTNLRGE